MTVIPLKQRDLFTKRWRKVEQRAKEVSFHIQLAAMLRWCIRPNVMWRHVPNGERRDPATASKLKAMGVLPGSADLEFHWIEIDREYPHRMRRRLLHLELKAGNRPTSEAQNFFALTVRLLGDDYRTARSIDEAVGILGEAGLIMKGVTVCGRRW